MNPVNMTKLYPGDNSSERFANAYNKINATKVPAWMKERLIVLKLWELNNAEEYIEIPPYETKDIQVHRLYFRKILGVDNVHYYSYVKGR